MDEVIFLSMDEIEAIHADQLQRHGGQAGYVDRGQVISAMSQPMMTFGGEYLHEDLPSMAAAYLFYLARSQGFADGNKRTAVAAATTFLHMNGLQIDAPETELYKVAIAVATGQLDKDGLVLWIDDHLAPLP